MLGHPPVAASKWDGRLRVAPEWPKENAPLSAAVESDIVGYSTVEAGSSWTLLGINFASLDDEGGQGDYSVQEISGNFQDGDEIQVWDETRYTTLFYFSSESMGTAGFYGDDGSLSTLRLTRGTAVWVKSSSLTHAILAGEVVLDEGNPVKGTSGWSLFAAKTPQATAVNEFRFSGLTEGDEMQIWDGKQYVTLFYFPAETLGVSGFYEDSGVLSERKVPVGSGFWIKSKAAVTLN